MYEVVIIGSGFSGLCMGIELKNRGIESFLILEKEMDLGGTWRDNTYPGAECDIPSALYSYSFEPNPDWNFKWSHQGQILGYLKHCASKYSLSSHLRFGECVDRAKYDEMSKSWKTWTKNGEEFESRHLITAIGQLHHPKNPQIPGLENFQGPRWHSSRWNHEIDLTGQRIGVIGSAASAIQFVPCIAEKAGMLYIFQRSANWILPKLDRPYKKWEKNLRRVVPFVLKLERLRLWLTGGVLFFFMGKGGWIRRFGERKAIAHLKRNIEDTKLVKKLVPDYPMGAKRILFSDDYFKALTLDKVFVEEVSISGVDKNGVQLSDSRSIELDILICATGFHSNPFLKGLDIRGKNDIPISDHWRDGERTYLGITTNDFPNFFMMYGPNTNLGHNSVVIMSECQARYISKCIIVMKRKRAKEMEVRKEVVNSFYKSIQKRLEKSVWTTIEYNWYQSKGVITNNWPGRTWEYIRKTSSPRTSNYIFK